MCGIVGGVNIKWNDSPLEKLAHRGPDYKCFLEWKNVYLGHTRLSIQDLSDAGHQPMSEDGDNLVIVFNGEIYNHLEVRKELLEKGYHFKSHSDTETILIGWKEWGSKVLAKLNGIYALSILDKKGQKLYLTRDKFGVKPLYLYEKYDKFSFSSELKVFGCLEEFDSTLNLGAFLNYLSFLWSPGKDTPYKYVNKVLPGEIVTIDLVKNKIETRENLFEDSFQGKYSSKTEDQLTDELDELLQLAVKRQMLSDVPVGFFLSGGLDSSLLVAIAKKLNPDKKLECFTINSEGGMEKEGFSDDLPYARKIAKSLNVNLNEVVAKTPTQEEFDKLIWHLDEPQADLAPINVLEISRQARSKGIKVLIGGAAGDDLFSGYRRHLVLSKEKYWDKIPKSILSFGSSIINKVPGKSSVIRRAKKLTRDWGKDKNLRFLGYFNWLPNDDMVHQLINPELLKEITIIDPYSYGKEVLKGISSHVEDLDKMLVLEQKTFLVDHNLNYTDKMSMAEGVEARVPYLDFELAEFAGSVPVDLKLKDGTLKYLLKKVGERYLDKDVIYRSKTGFGSPVREMIETSLKPMIENQLNNEFIDNQGVFNSKFISSILNDHKKGKFDYSYIILSLLAMQSWLRQFEWKLD